MRMKSLAVTFLETLGVYLKDYSKRRKSYVLCFWESPTLALIALLQRLGAISPREAGYNRTFIIGKIPFVVVILVQRHNDVERVTKEALMHGFSRFAIWHRGRHIQRSR